MGLQIKKKMDPRGTLHILSDLFYCRKRLGTTEVDCHFPGKFTTLFAEDFLLPTFQFFMLLCMSQLSELCLDCKET